VLVETTLGDVDVIGMCLPADEAIGKGDLFILEQLARYPRAKVVAIVTKTDRVSSTAVSTSWPRWGSCAIGPLSFRSVR